MRVLSEACQVVRPVSVCVAAMGVIACAMAIQGWEVSSLVLGGLIVPIAGVLVFQVHRAVGQLRRQSTDVSDAAHRAAEHYVSMLRRVVRFVEAREQYTRGHSERVGRLAEQVARQMRRPEPYCRLLRVAGELHDIGLLAVPDNLLNMRANLSVSAFRTVKKHAEVSYEILKPLRALDPVLPAILHHHERMNGTGYPKGLEGECIPLGARILAVADAYDAMTHDRPHRPAMPALQAVEELRRCTPAGYDPVCVAMLEEVLGVGQVRPLAAPAEAAVPAGA